MCLELPILTEMTAKFIIYFHFLCKIGVIYPFGVKWGFLSA